MLSVHLFISFCFLFWMMYFSSDVCCQGHPATELLLWTWKLPLVLLVLLQGQVQATAGAQTLTASACTGIYSSKLFQLM